MPRVAQKISDKRIAELSHLIREGGGDRVRAELATVTPARVPRERIREVAELARRADLSDLALRLLYPHVRGKKGGVASDAERAEYAASLTRIGGTGEALALLEKIPEKANPETLLFQSLALFTRWDYAPAIPLLSRYIKAPGVLPYGIALAKTNLAMAMVYERRARDVEAVLRELIHETSVKRWYLLLGNALQIAAWREIGLKRWREAETFLARAADTLKTTGARDAFFVDKWRAVLALARDHERLAPIDDIRARATKRGHWESLRDCDRHQAVLTRDESLLNHVYFGTPFPAFRARLLNDFGRDVRPPERFVRALGARPTRELEATGAPTTALDKLFVTLASDFYRPFSSAELFFRVFPEEFFNPQSSVHRVHQLVRRFRAWLKTAKLPLGVAESEGHYRLVATEECALVMHREIAGGKEDKLLRELRARFAERAFSMRDVAEATDMAERTLRRYLLSLVDDGKLVREGNRATTTYRFVEK